MVRRKRYRQHWTPGAVMQIDLGDGGYGYGQVLETRVAFFDYKTVDSETPDLKEIVKSPVLFKLCVSKFSVTQDWKKIGKLDINPETNKEDDQYVHDKLSNKLTIWKADGTKVVANWEDCKELEPIALWNPWHVEQRLRDHFARRPCWYVESMKPDWEFILAKEFYRKYGYNFVSEEEEQSKLTS